MNSETWTRPSIVAMAKNPPLLAEWRAKVAAWEAEHPELAAAWDAAFLEADERERMVDAAREMRSELETAGVPLRYVDVIAAGARKTVGVEAVRKFLTEKATFLVLSGAPGCGKSIAACVALYGGGLFVRASEAARLSSFDREDKRRFDSMATTGALVLDDLGAEMLHDGWRPNLEELFDRRYGDKRRTVITTNLPPASADPSEPTIKSRYGERIARRIREDGRLVLCGDRSLGARL